MKQNLKVPAAIAAVCIVAVVCVLGGKVAVDTVYADRVAQSKAATDKAAQLVTKAPTIMAPISTPNPNATPTPAPKPTGETVTVEENGDITIRPDWSQNIADPNAPSNTTAEGNMGGGGGGKVDLPSNSETPTTPAPSKAPQNTPAVPKPETTPAPTKAPQVTPNPTPAPTATPTPETPDSGENTPPAKDGVNGETSADGKYFYIDGFGWVLKGNGSHSEPSKGTNTQLSGEKVGIM